MGVGGTNTKSGKKITSSQNDEDGHWKPHFIITNEYRRSLGRRVKLTAQFHILANIRISRFLPHLHFLPSQRYNN
jgi:hypothetical protein